MIWFFIGSALVLSHTCLYCYAYNRGREMERFPIDPTYKGYKSERDHRQ